MCDATNTGSSWSEEPRAPERDGLRLFVVERTAARFVYLPASGALIIGRDPEADIQLQDPVASRRHAKVVVDEGGVRVSDCGSRNGLRVNGARVEGGCDLSAGDVIEIGAAALVLGGGQRTVSRRLLAGTQEIVQRIQREIDGAIQIRRPMTLAVITLGPRPQAFSSTMGSVERGLALSELERAVEPRLCALDVAGRLGDGSMVVAFGDRTATEVRGLAARVLEQLLPTWPSAKVGVASCPEDGNDALSLISACWSVAESTTGSGARGAEQAPGADPPSAPGTEPARTDVAPPEQAVSQDAAAPAAEPPVTVFRHLSQEIQELERRRIVEALQATRGIKTRAAKLIGVPERTFRLKLRQYGLP